MATGDTYEGRFQAIMERTARDGRVGLYMGCRAASNDAPGTHPRAGVWHKWRGDAPCRRHGPEDRRPATVPLIIIDVQQGFINAATAHVPARATALQARYEAVVATRFINPEGSAHRRLIGWHRFAPGSAEAALAFAPAPGAIVLDKTTYSARDTDLLARLGALDATEVHLCGIATDNCVLATALLLFEAGLRPVVLADACASHAGADYHDWGLRILRRLIGAAQVVEGGGGVVA